MRAHPAPTTGKIQVDSAEGGGLGAAVFKPEIAISLYSLEFPPQRVDIPGLWE